MNIRDPHRIGILCLIGLMAVGLSTCKKKLTTPTYDSPYDETSETYIPTPDLNTAAVTDIKALSATSGGQFQNDYGKPVTAKGVCWSLAPNPTIEASCSSDGSATTNYASNLTGLLADTLYYVRAYATNEAGTIYGGQRSFRTRDGVPTFSGLAVSNLTSSGASVALTVDQDGGDPITARGVCYSKEPDPTTAGTCIASGTGTGAVAVAITGLDRATAYYVRPYATNAVMTAYGAQVSFVTLAVLPTVATGSVNEVGATTATVAGEVTSDGGAPQTTRGICYATTQNPTTAGTCVASGSGTGTYTATLTGLANATTYYVRAYATNSAGTAYGDEISFTTTSTGSTDGRDNTTAVVEVTNPATGRVWMDRNLGASRAATSSTDAEAYGDLYQWGRGADGHQKRNSPTTSTLSPTDQPGHGNFIPAPNSPRDWRSPQNDNLWQGANGTNNPCPVGYRLPTEAEWNAERASWSSSNSAGAFKSPLKLPVAGDRNSSTGSLDFVGSFGSYWSSSVSGALARYPYFGSSVADVNSASRAYGRSVRCLRDGEPQASLAIVTTNAVSSITSSSAVSGGNVTATGGAAVTARGVVWSTSQNPTLVSNAGVSNDGSGTGVFTSNLTGLSPSTTYFVRAYATNSAGTAYGVQTSFSTSTGLATVSTGAILNIATDGALVTGEVLSTGETAVTTFGVCYAITPNPTVSGTCTAVANDQQTIETRITGLFANNVYFVRAFATNSAGTAYGSNEPFTTTAAALTVTDIDGNVYPTVQIGTQVWMAANLRTTRYRTGAMINNVTLSSDWASLTTGAWVHYVNSTDNETVYGKLYNWYAVADSRNICPTGWHVPSDAEWTVLSTFLATDVGFKMKSTSRWDTGNGSNASGFNGLPGGARQEDLFGYIFTGVGSFGPFWSSSEVSSIGAFYRGLTRDSRDLARNTDFKRAGFSVRCVRD